VVSCSGTPRHLARRGREPATFLSPDPLLPTELLPPLLILSLITNLILTKESVDDSEAVSGKDSNEEQASQKHSRPEMDCDLQRR